MPEMEELKEEEQEYEKEIRERTRRIIVWKGTKKRRKNEGKRFGKVFISCEGFSDLLFWHPYIQHFVYKT